jgi:hypothetical protein
MYSNYASFGNCVRQILDFHPKYGVDNYTGYFSDPGSTSGLTSLQQQTYSLADLRFGVRSHYEINNYAVAHLRQRMYFGYVQDDFKASDKLTFNLGVRYEYATPQWERDNHLSNFNPATGTLTYASNGSLYNRALVHPDPHNWAPGQGTATCTSVNDAAGASFRPTNLGFPSNFATPAAFNTATTQIRYIPANNRTGYVQTWHFTVAREFSHNLVLDVAYIGNHDVGLMILADANQAAPSASATGPTIPVNNRRPIPNFATIAEAFSGGFGSYNALQAKLEKRYSGGLYFINSFTWSKAIDNAPRNLENYNGDNSRINILNPTSERGVSSYDQTFNNTTSVVYDIPVGAGRHFALPNRAVDLIAGGWSLDVINSATSGLPINITYSPTTAGPVSPLLTPRPNLTGAPLYASGGNPTQLLNPAAFSISSVTQPFGAAGRNIVRGPSVEELDLGLHKNFALWSETSRLEFRAEAFNILNKTMFTPTAGFGTTFGSTGFGTFTQTLPPRQIQMALKLVF